MARTYKKRDERVMEMIYAAEKEFVEKGYDAVTVADIAKRMGVSSSLVYQYFPDKASLLSFVCDRLFEPVAEMMNRETDGENGAETLHRFIRDYLSFWERNPRLAEFFVLDRAHAMQDHQRQMHYLGTRLTLSTWLYTTLKRGEKEGVLREHNKFAQSDALLFALEGAMMRVAVIQDMKAKSAAARIEKAMVPKRVKG